MREKLLLDRIVQSEKDSKKFAGEITAFFKNKDIVLLYGDLGSGKTFLVREFVRLLGLKAEVSSPSFTLINQYFGKIDINHIDLYRIANEYEIINLGLDDYWELDCINFVEWPQIIENIITWDHYRLIIETDKRQISWRRFRLIYCHE
jgi:tRNA threonylcarbamoyl adenosine modification protein YjeE